MGEGEMIATAYVRVNADTSQLAGDVQKARVPDKTVRIKTEYQQPSGGAPEGYRSAREQNFSPEARRRATRIESQSTYAMAREAEESARRIPRRPKSDIRPGESEQFLREKEAREAAEKNKKQPRSPRPSSGSSRRPGAVRPTFVTPRIKDAEKALDKFTDTAATAASTLGQFQRGSNPLFSRGGLLRSLGSGVGVGSMALTAVAGAAYGSAKFASAQYQEAGTFSSYRATRQMGPYGPQLTAQAMQQRGEEMIAGRTAAQISGFGTPNGEEERIRGLKDQEASQLPGWIKFKKGIASLGEDTKDSASWISRGFKKAVNWTEGMGAGGGIIGRAFKHETLQQAKEKERQQQAKEASDQKAAEKERNDRILKMMSKSPILNEQYQRGQVEAFMGIAGGTATSVTSTPTQRELTNALEGFKDHVARVTGNYGSN